MNLARGARAVVGAANVIDDPDALWTYAYDATMGFRSLPGVIAFPETEAEIQELVRLAIYLFGRCL